METEVIESAALDQESGEPGGVHVELRRTDTYDLLVLAGEIGPDGAGRVHEAALEAAAGGKDVALDWSRAGRVGPAAVQVLLALRAAVELRGGEWFVAADQEGVRRTLETAGLAVLFPARGAAR